MAAERRLAARLARSALFWLGLQAAVVFLGLALGGHLESQLGPDSQGFRWQLASGDFQYFLTSKRTFVYPVFLATVEAATGDYAAVASLQAALYLGSVMLLGWALRRFLGSELLAAGAASPLFYFTPLSSLANLVASDVLGAALAIATFALLLHLLARAPGDERSRGGLLAFGGSLFLCYQCRPSYLFLVPLLPLLGWAVATWRARGPRRACRELFLPLALVATLPLLGWSTLRFLVVGEFGLVSFAGMNVIGITAPMVSPEIVPRLPAEYRLFATRLLRQRMRHGLAPLEPEVSYQRWRNEYNRYAHFVSADALLRTVGGKPGTKKAPWAWANRFYSRFSLAMIRLRPDLYLRWLRGASGETLAWAAAEPVLRWSGLALLGALAAALLRLRLGRPWRPSCGPLCLLAMALAWALAGQLLVIAVEVPLARYNLANFLFMPGALLALAFDSLKTSSPSP